MDELPLTASRHRTLVLLVGRVTTIKLAYWAALTVFELALPALLHAPIATRLGWSVAGTAALSALALLWAARAARAADRRAGVLERSLPTVATAFVAASVVASPASLPLLIVARQRAAEGCPIAVCQWEPMILWVVALVVGMVLVPAAFTAAMRARA
ncbi:MAG TPA: hypothetical protein VMJ92_00155 [Candidatus Limnocylindrales bacterium]|nr:hypothetical protein [Candidatus Limnocylindrales bacterium]